MSKLKIMAILASTRQNRAGEKIYEWAKPQLVDNPDAEFEFVDLRDWKMDYYDEPVSASVIEEYTDKKAQEWSDKVAQFDAYLIFTPEYNNGYPAVLKNALDLTYRSWNKKAVGFVGWGTVGAARAIQQLKEVSVELQMAPIREALHLPLWDGAVDENGVPAEKHKAKLKKVADQLIWWAQALKAAREQAK